MSSLNNEATKTLLLEEDLLSSSGAIKGIWDVYIKNVDFQNKDNDVLKVILKSLETNVINHLALSDDELEKCVTSFTKMVNDVCTGMSQNELTVFLLVLVHALSDYSSIKSDTLDNIEINIEESVSKISQIDEFKVLSAMERYGLLDSVELQSLLDDRNLAVTTACSNVCRRWGKNSPSNEGSDVSKKPLLSLKDFLPQLDEVFLKAREMFVWKSMVTDNFPDTPDYMRKLIMPKDDFDGRWFYQQGTYLVNLANLQILTATAQYIISILELDSITALYTLSMVNEKIKETINQIGPAQSLLFSQLLVIAMTIRYMIQDRGEDSPDTRIAVDSLRDQLRELVRRLDDCRQPVVLDEMMLFRKSDVINNYVSFVTSATAITEESAQNDDLSASEALNAAMEGLLSGVEDIRSAVAAYASGESVNVADGVVLESRGVLSSLTQSSVEQTPSGNDMRNGVVSVAVECGKSLHNELNQALMDGDLENAANAIAREIAFEQGIVRLPYSRELMEAMRPIVESVQMDISTYSALMNKVPGGIAKYQQSAAEYVEGKLRANV